MPLLITDKIINASEQMEPGWTKLRCTEVKEVSKDGKSNTIITFEGLAGPGNAEKNVGRSLAHFISHNAIAGDNPIAEVVMDMLKLIAAFNSCTVEEAKNLIRGKELNFNAFVEKEIWGEIVDDTVQGKLYKKIKAFQPADVTPF